MVSSRPPIRGAGEGAGPGNPDKQAGAGRAESGKGRGHSARRGRGWSREKARARARCCGLGEGSKPGRSRRESDLRVARAGPRTSGHSLGRWSPHWVPVCGLLPGRTHLLGLFQAPGLQRRRCPSCAQWSTGAERPGGAQRSPVESRCSCPWCGDVSGRGHHQSVEGHRQPRDEAGRAAERVRTTRRSGLDRDVWLGSLAASWLRQPDSLGPAEKTSGGGPSGERQRARVSGQAAPRCALSHPSFVWLLGKPVLDVLPYPRGPVCRGRAPQLLRDSAGASSSAAQLPPSFGDDGCASWRPGFPCSPGPWNFSLDIPGERQG